MTPIVCTHGGSRPWRACAPVSPRNPYRKTPRACTPVSPDGEPLRAVTIVGEVTGAEPEPSEVIPGGFRLAARLREIEPLSLDDLRELLPVARLRFGFLELKPTAAEAIWALVAALQTAPRG